MSTELRRLRCECGWEIVGPEAEVVAAVMDHGARLHNMHATREAVLARLESVPAAEDRRDAESA